MRPWLIVFIALAAAPVRAETPQPLAEAVQKLVNDENHWAYTRTTQRLERGGKPHGGPFVERCDPSQPFAKQWELVKYDGREPTALERGIWRHQKQREVKRRDEKSLGDVLDLEHATVAGESTGTATYLVPILPGLSRRFPADQLEVFMEVDKASRELKSFSLQPRGPFRVIGVLKVDSGEATGTLEVVKPGYAPTFVRLRAGGVGHLLGIFKITRDYEVTFSDFRRVKPYNDRFEVKIGDVKALNF